MTITPSLSTYLSPANRGPFLAAKLAQRAGAGADNGQWAACAQDAAHFINAYVVIDEPQGGDVATVPFHLWPAQAEVLGQLLVERLVIFLKARQIGLTWLACAYGLWLCLFKPGRVVLCFSKTEDDAKELTRRFRVMYQRLPDWLRARVPLQVDNTTDLEWENGSRVQARAATKAAGRSLTCSLAILDEFAFMQYGPDVYTALKPTIDGGGQLFLISTANGEGGLFAELWQKAVAGLNNFRAVFLSWRARPGRDEAWRARVASEALSSALDLQEYPAAPADAFQNTGGEPFLPSLDVWDILKGDFPALTPHEALVVAGDAATGRAAEASDCFGLLGVGEHPARPGVLAVRYVNKWQASKGQKIDFDGQPDNPGPLAEVRRLHRDYSLLQFAYDETQMAYAASQLRQEGIWCDPFLQGVDRLESDRLLLDLILQRRIVHDGHPDLREHLRNADRKLDPETRKVRIVKRTESQKIDLAVCLSMACARAVKLILHG